MYKKLIIFCLSFFLINSFSVGIFGEEDFSVEQNRNRQEKLLRKRIEKMKNDPGSLFYAKSSLSRDEQEKLARGLVEEIEKLSKVSGFDSPDHQKIFKKICRILKEAPDSRITQMAHWKIFPYYNGLLGDKDSLAAQGALESFLEKYQSGLNKYILKEAYDKLSLCAKRQKSWELLLFYSDKYLELEPNAYPHILNKAKALLELDQKREATKLLERIIKESPNTVQYNLAVMMLDEIALSVNSKELMQLYTEAMKRIRKIAIAIERYRISNKKIPQRLSDLVPDYLESLQKDPWGNEFELKPGDKSQAYFLICKGSNSQFEGLDQKGKFTQLKGKDIIFAEGYPIFSPAID